MKLMNVVMMLVFLSTFGVSIAKTYYTSYTMEQTFNEVLPSGFWVYHGCCFMINTILVMMDVIFVVSAGIN